MRHQNLPGRDSPQRMKAATMASLMARLRRPHDLARITILLLILAHARMRPGYRMVEPPRPRTPHAPRRLGARKKSFSIKRPRERFL